MNRQTNYKPLFKEMRIRRGEVYTFFGMPAMGKTKLAIDLTAHFSYDKKLKGIFLSNDMPQRMADAVTHFDNTKFIDHHGRLHYMFEDIYDYNKINGLLANNNADFLVVDTAYHLHSEGNESKFITHLKEIAKQNDVFIICTAPLGRLFDMNAAPKKMLEKSKEKAIARRLIHHSDFVAFINRWSYNNVTFGDNYNLSCDFIIAKSNYRNTIAHIKNFATFMLPVGKFPSNSSEWYS
ncbi:MAG: hypothetical protein J1E36_02965 [Eubacterium sp.]|nr:hypothetical protein [Eubacterium sp.]